VVVYDLGGGTFDTSLVRMRARHHEILASAGHSRLGGDDFDRVLLNLALSRAGLDGCKLAAPHVLERLLDQCREAKERLSPSSRKVSIDLDGIVGHSKGASDITIAAQDYYDACAPLVERTIETMVPLMAHLNEVDDVASGDGGIGTSSTIAGIYVVGGASALPSVARALRARFGRRVHRSPYPSAAVAIGLAIACDKSSGFELSDQYARTFGVFREGAAGTEITFDPIFKSDTPIPGQGAMITCRRSYRAAHNVGHFRFIECSAVGADGQPRGDALSSGDVLFPFDPALRETQLDLTAVPVRRIDGPGPRIEEEYTLDEHGIVGVTIRNLDYHYQRAYQVGEA
jgi:molecular chaperone DnaK (HSP70)